MEHVDPTCVHADVPDKLNDIFMYRLHDRQLITTASQASSSNSNDTSPVVVFKCANNEARILVDSIRNGTGKPLKHPKGYFRSLSKNTKIILLVFSVVQWNVVLLILIMVVVEVEVVLYLL